MDNIKHKLSHIDKNKIAIAARKSLIAADPLYHSWPSQEQYRATKNEVAQRKVRRVLLNDLLYIMSPESLDDLHNISEDEEPEK